MIMSASRTGDMNLTVEDMERAIKFLNEAEGSMPYAFQGMGKNPYADIQAKIIRFVAEKGEIQLDELTEMFMNDVSQRELADILMTLDQTKILQVVTRGPNVGLIRYRKKKPISPKNGELAKKGDEYEGQRDTETTAGIEEDNGE